MKNLKTTLTTTKYLLLALLVAFTFSCDSEDGADGEQGPAGQNGQDGNANVQTFTFNTSSINSNNFSFTFPELSQDIVDNDAILTYIKRGNAYFSIPGISFDDMMEVELQAGDLDIYFYNKNNGNSLTPPIGRYELLKVVIIESNNTTVLNRMSQSNDIYSKLENANVDINDYYAVCDYLGINY